MLHILLINLNGNFVFNSICMQISVRTVLRLLVIHVYKERMVKSPPIQPLNRDMLNELNDEKLKEGFTLKRSGTVVRSIRSTKSIHMRTWESLSSVDSNNDNLNVSTTSEKKFILAEVNHYIINYKLLTNPIKYF